MKFALYLLEEGLKGQLEEKKCLAKASKQANSKTKEGRKSIIEFRKTNKENILGLKKVINYIKTSDDK